MPSPLLTFWQTLVRYRDAVNILALPEDAIPDALNALNQGAVVERHLACA
jgi:hypothetical protein